MNESINRLKLVRQRIESACIAAGRKPEEVSLLAVGKRHPSEKMSTLHELGVKRFGENQLQEARQKQKELAHLAIQWHFIGAMQSNKTRPIAEHFHWVQSVDRKKILTRLSQQRPDGLEPLNICLQVNIDREPQKAGVDPEDILQLASYSSGLDNIKLRGLMAIPMVTTDLNQQHDSFRRVRVLFETLRNEGYDLDTLSMGMSSDLETAIAEGSTMVRIGTDLFGKRA